MVKKYTTYILFFLVFVAIYGIGVYLTYSPDPHSAFQQSLAGQMLNFFSKEGNKRAKIALESEKQLPINATFAIYTNGTFRIFTAPMYHNLSEDAYITAENPDTVTVIKTGITWNDFFATLPFSLDQNCLTTGTGETFCNSDTQMLKFYINGVKTPDALSKEIQNGDRLLVSFGPLNDPQIPSQLANLSNL